MLPLHDDVPSRSLPLVTVSLIAANVLVFLYQVSLQQGGDPAAARAAGQFIGEFGVIPCRVAGWVAGHAPEACGASAGSPHPALTVLSSMFLHGGLFHAGGNMLYLWVFGNNVEDTLGHLRFLGFYLASGVAAALAQTAVNPASTVPMVGASGAVSGVLGAYLVLFPHARILTLVTFVFIIRFVRIPALIVLGFWVVVQLLNGFVTFSAGGGGEGGVAWFAHVGGFAAGLVLLFLLRPRARKSL
jgi:membrane associated rhomboid family serine protease